jgi:hypothetical protein
MELLQATALGKYSIGTKLGTSACPAGLEMARAVPTTVAAK